MPTPVAIAPAPVAPAPTAAAKPVAASSPVVAEAEPTFEVTVGGKPTKLTRKQIEKFAGKGSFADQAIRQAKEALAATQAEKAAREQLKAKIKTDKAARDAWLREHGIEPDEFSRERLAEKLRDAEMTPEQRAIAERDARIAELEKATKAAADEKAEQQLTANAQRMQQYIENELGAAWERAGFQRGDAEAFNTVYEVMDEWHKLGLLPRRAEDFSAAFADRIIDTARENMEAVDKRREAAVLKGLKGKQLFDRLGKATVDEVLRYAAEELRAGRWGAKRPNGAAPSQPRQTDAPTFLTPQQAMKAIR